MKRLTQKEIEMSDLDLACEAYRMLTYNKPVPETLIGEVLNILADKWPEFRVEMQKIQEEILSDS